ncbi:MAG: hypothetical protein H6838_15875 [Planctomycetes bacterium]|nr:hypothetical protein [Planctomycetota bacterium]
MRKASTEPRDTTGFASSGQSPGAAPRQPRLHLVGVGKVGREVLARVAGLPACLVAVTDSSGTLYAGEGVDAAAVAAHKHAGGRIADLPRAEDLPTELAVALIGADVLIDATPTDAASTQAAAARVRAAVRLGASVALSGKNALAACAPEWLTTGARRQFGIDAVLGGTGRQLLRELDELRAGCARVVLVGNVTTTVLIEAIERGQSLEQGLQAARARGLLESDPSADLDGSDAATKLVCVVGAVFGESFVRPRSPDEVPREDLRELDPALLRARFARGATTRLVARGDRAGGLRVAFEEVAVGSPLAAPADRVVYGYELAGGLRVHTGLAVGADRTAEALLGDVRAALAEVRS